MFNLHINDRQKKVIHSLFDGKPTVMGKVKAINDNVAVVEFDGEISLNLPADNIDKAGSFVVINKAFEMEVFVSTSKPKEIEQPKVHESARSGCAYVEPKKMSSR